MVMTLSKEEEIGAMYVNVYEALPQRIELIEMGHPQPRTPIQTGKLAAN